jgi:hypothetical protein
MPTTRMANPVMHVDGCGVCTDMHARALREAGASEERVWPVRLS